MGRLFDAVSALIGIRQEVSYEGQAAIELETIANPNETGVYPYSIQDGIIGISPIIESVIEDLKHNIQPGIISAMFHNTIADLSLDSIVNILNDVDCNTVVLSGGVWQNSLLLELTARLLREKDIKILMHRLLPPNDGCISLGQAVVAGMNYKRKI
jgi:hydrogenase maturation protein HypF